MTAFAVDFRRDRLIVAGDSLAYSPDRVDAKPLGFIPKIVPIPHLRAVLFARGMHVLTVRAAAYLMLSPSLFTVEAAAEALPEVLQRISEEYADQVGIPDWRALGLLELVLAGWSESESRMRLFSFASYENYKTHADNCHEYGLLPFPRLPSEYMPDTGSMTTDESLVAIIQAAGRMFTNPVYQMGSARVGGEVVAFELTPDGMSQRTLHRFENYFENMHAGAAVTRRYESGKLEIDVATGLVPIAEAVDSATGERVRVAAPANDTPSRQARRHAERLARKVSRRA